MPYLQDTVWQEKYHMIAYDRPGYGQSIACPMTSIDDQAQILLNIISRYSANSIYLIGHSYGAPIAAYAAAVDSSCIRSVMMIAPLIDPESEPIFRYSYFAHWKLTKWLLPNALQVAGDEKFSHAQQLKEILDNWEHLTKKVWHIHGQRDGLAPLTPNVAFTKEHITYHEVITYADEGHLIIWDNPTLIRESIVNMLNE